MYSFDKKVRRLYDSSVSKIPSTSGAEEGKISKRCRRYTGARLCWCMYIYSYTVAMVVLETWQSVVGNSWSNRINNTSYVKRPLKPQSAHGYPFCTYIKYCTTRQRG